MRDFINSFIYAVWYALKDVFVLVSIIFDLVMFSIVWGVKIVVNFIFKVIDFISFWVGYYIFLVKSWVIMNTRGIFSLILYIMSDERNERYNKISSDRETRKIRKHRIKDIKRGLRKYGEGYIILHMKYVTREFLTLAENLGETIEDEGYRSLIDKYKHILELEKRYKERKKKVGIWKRLIKWIRRQFLIIKVR